MVTRASQPQPGALAAGQQAQSKDTQVVRFDVHQRIQHSLMMSSFIVLALTGLPQRFSELGVSQWWVGSLGGLETVRTIHRVAATVMLADCAYHVGYLFYRIGVQRRFGCFRMVPTFKDLRDGLQTIRYFLGLAPEKPKFDRFNYLEKFDYWAVFWGIAIIGGSGLMLMFPVAVTRLLPGQAVSVALILHADEAILATGWILVMHMFNVHLAPWVFPFNPAIFTGKMSATRYAEDHPLEWASLEAAGAAPVDQRGSAGRRRALGSVWTDRARNLAVLIGKRTRMMRARALVTLLVVGGLLLAGPLGWADGNADSPPSPAATPTPTSSPAVTPMPTSSPEATPTPAAAPIEPADLTHRAAVVQQFLCQDCHLPDSGWLMPDDDDHALPQEQACDSCHAPAPQPEPVAVHRVHGDTDTQELCALCHRDPGRLGPRPVAPQIAAAQSCSSCHEGDQRVDSPKDHEGLSVATCSLCHATQTLVSQALPHKVKGWEECSFCHGEGRLAPLKGGHLDLADDECQRCHDAALTPPLMTKAMLDYKRSRGEDLHGPLLSDEAERAEVMCVLCHSAVDE